MLAVSDLQVSYGAISALAGISFDTERSLIVSRIYTLPVAGGPLTCLTAGHPADDLRPRYSDGGGRILYGMTHDPLFYADHVRLMVYERASGTHTEYWPLDDLSPTAWEFLVNGALVFSAEEDARVRLFAFDNPAGPRPLTEDGSVGGFTISPGGRVLFTLQDLAHPAEAWAVGAGLKCDEPPVRLTHFTAEVAARYAMGEVRELTCAGAQGETVQTFVVLPPGFEPGTKYPLVHVVHA